MNLCILLGKVISEIEFNFIINSKNKSIAYFDMQLLNESIIRIKAYNEIADYVYRKLKKGQIVVVEGKIRDDGTVECINRQGKKGPGLFLPSFNNGSILHF